MCARARVNGNSAPVYAPWEVSRLFRFARAASARVCNETWTASRLYAFRYMKKKNFFSPLDMFLEHTPASPSAVVTRPGTLPDHNLTASSRTRCPARSVKFPVGKKQISKNPPSVHLLFKSHSWREPTHAYPALCTVSFARVCVYLIRHFIYIYI